MYQVGRRSDPTMTCESRSMTSPSSACRTWIRDATHLLEGCNLIPIAPDPHDLGTRGWHVGWDDEPFVLGQDQGPLSGPEVAVEDAPGRLPKGVGGRAHCANPRAHRVGVQGVRARRQVRGRGKPNVRRERGAERCAHFLIVARRGEVLSARPACRVPPCRDHLKLSDARSEPDIVAGKRERHATDEGQGCGISPTELKAITAACLSRRDRSGVPVKAVRAQCTDIDRSGAHASGKVRVHLEQIGPVFVKDLEARRERR